ARQRGGGVGAVRVWEPHPPQGCEAVEWLILTDQQARGRRRLRVVAGYYECRAVAEEFNKCQKTGVGIESLQLQSRAGLEVMIALLSVVAVALVNLRVAARQQETAARPAWGLVGPLGGGVLSGWRHGGARGVAGLPVPVALG